MCGIVGYIGNRDVVTVLIEGLKKLEYRGYDSAGVAVFQDGRIERRRCKGKIRVLSEQLARNPLQGEYGIGHTRWATHGRPSEENAHPHQGFGGRVVVVHNGIIENYLALKKDLLGRGRKFVSETDTEVIAHLLEEEEGVPLEEAVRRVSRKLEGYFALAVIDHGDPGKLVAARNGQSLIIGLGDGEYFAASDAPAILEFTQEVVYLEDGQTAAMTVDGVRIEDADGKLLHPPSQRINWSPVMAEKRGFKHFMLKEIFEQPEAVRETVAGRMSLASGNVHLNEINISDQDLAGFQKVHLVACGTSWHAALVGKFLIEELARIPVEVDYGSEYRYRSPLVNDKTLAVVISQSGETADTLAGLREARSRGATVISICNVRGSIITRESTGTIHTHAGPEVGVASTKAFTTQLAVLYLLALKIGQVHGRIDSAKSLAMVEELSRIPHLMERTLEMNGCLEAFARKFRRTTNFLYLGRSLHYPIALEGALKLKEISYIHAEGYPAGEMKHGPIALIDENMPVVILATHDTLYEKIKANVEEVKTRQGTVIAICSEGDKELGGIVDYALYVPRTIPGLTPLLEVLPLQMLAYHIAVELGCDVDQPRNLAKSVTVE
jgi:glucosamine--fructose-6-phosphate aminotransferase (isomerizing)